MTVHDLKCWPDEFEAIDQGVKRSEVRINDRNFAVGDIVGLSEYRPDRKEYTGRFCRRMITYITQGGTFGLPQDLCVLSLAKVPKP